MRSILSMPACIAMLLSLTACSHGPWGTAQTKATTSPSAATKPTTAPAMIPLPAPTPDERLAVALDHLGAKRGPRGEVLTLPGKDFPPGRAKLENAGTADLEHLAAVLHDYPKADLFIEGYTDDRGSPRDNKRLSLERAEAVKQTLINDGLDSTRLRAQGLGPVDPIGDNKTQAGREENRRVELVFSDADGTFRTASTKHQSKTG